MTTYYYCYKNDEVTVEVKGHAGYSQSGKDIVCAAISTACIMTANLIDKLNLSYNILDLVAEDGYFRLQAKASDNVILGIIQNLIETLDSLQGEYPKYLKYKG